MTTNAVKQSLPPALIKLLRPIYRPLRRLIRFIKWVIPASVRLVKAAPESNRRLLVIYDLSCQPYSIGDILHMQEAALALREKHGVAIADFALVYDQHSPSSTDKAFACINPDNVHYYLASLLPVLQVNPFLGSFMVFNSHEQLEKYITDNIDRYVVWPSAWRYAQRDYLNYIIFNELLYDYYQVHGFIPSLTCRPYLRDVALDFFYRHVWPDIPVTVQTRNNPFFCTQRNAHMDSWVAFFNRCNGRYPVKFIVICSFSEVDNRLRECSNVIIAKDHHTSVEQELAMIHEAAMHMGSSSGMATMAEFNNKPYLIVNTDLDPDLYRGIIREGNFVRFFFANHLQRFSLGRETPELLINEFDKIWSTINVDNWRKSIKRGDTSENELHSWLR